MICISEDITAIKERKEKEREKEEEKEEEEKERKKRRGGERKREKEMTTPMTTMMTDDGRAQCPHHPRGSGFVCVETAHFLAMSRKWVAFLNQLVSTRRATDRDSDER